MQTDTPLHPDLAPLAGLVGSWEGEGEGDYPTVDRFRYVEQTRFWHDGRPFLRYEQRTWAEGRSRPLHVETGFWRGYPDGTVEVTIAQTGGITEVAHGRVDDGVVVLRSTAIGRTAAAKRVDEVVRRYEIAGDSITHALDLAAVGQPLGPHLRIRLHRT